jgi:hypothetical protein
MLLDDAQNQTIADFQDVATKNSLGNSVTGKEMQEFLTNRSPFWRSEKLEEWWSKNGFGFMRGKDHNVNVRKLADSFQETRNAMSLDDNGKAVVDALIEELRADLGTATGRVSGDVILAARNKAAAEARKRSYGNDNNINALKTTLRDLVDDIDEHVAAYSADPKFKKMFKDEKAAYRNYLTQRDATAAAAANSGKAGQFGPDEWIAASSANNRRSLGKGRGPMQDAAYRARKEIDASAAKIAEAAQQAFDAAKDSADAGVSRARDHLKAELADLQRQANRNKRGRARRDSREAESRLLAQENTIDAMKKELIELEEVLRELKSATGGAKGWWAKHAATVLLGGVGAALSSGMGGEEGSMIGGAALGVASGYGMAKLLSQPGVMRAVAAQTGLEKTFKKFGDNVVSTGLPALTRESVQRKAAMNDASNEGQ